jgi:hypothetical protein
MTPEQKLGHLGVMGPQVLMGWWQCQGHRLWVTSLYPAALTLLCYVYQTSAAPCRASWG